MLRFYETRASAFDDDISVAKLFTDADFNTKTPLCSNPDGVTGKAFQRATTASPRSRI